MFSYLYQLFNRWIIEESLEENQVRLVCRIIQFRQVFSYMMECSCNCNKENENIMQFFSQKCALVVKLTQNVKILFFMVEKKNWPTLKEHQIHDISCLESTKQIFVYLKRHTAVA